MEKEQSASAAKMVRSEERGVGDGWRYSESFNVEKGNGSSKLEFLTVKVRVTSAPVSGTEVGSAVLVTVISGATSENDTVAVSVSVASVLSFSTALPVKVLE